MPFTKFCPGRSEVHDNRKVHTRLCNFEIWVFDRFFEVSVMTNVKLLLSAAYLLCQTRYGLAVPVVENSDTAVRVPGDAFNRIHGYNATQNKRRGFTTIEVWFHSFAGTPRTCNSLLFVDLDGGSFS